MTSVRRIALAYNNVYLVSDGPQRVLVDTGPDYDGAKRILADALGAPKPTVVVATHAHMDHASLGGWWQGQGVPVAIGARDAPFARAPADHVHRELDAQRAYATRSGAPADVRGEAIASLERRRRWAESIADLDADHAPPSHPPRWPTSLRYEPYDPAIPLAADAEVGAGLNAWLSPGHTPGNLVLVHRREGWLFSGDQLLPDLTPIPAFQLDASTNNVRFRSLPAFVASLRRLRGQGFTRCFPGHGEPFDAIDTTIAANLAAIEERTERVAALLVAGGSTTVYGLAERLYPRAVRRRFWQMVPTVQGHLDLLEEQRRVAVEDALYLALR